jgi:hypothetical protein
MAEPNPYAPPADLDPGGREAGRGEDAPAYKLYTPGHATLATFLGTPAAGLYIVSVNRRRLGLARAANTTLIAGLAVTAALFVAAVLLPDAVGRFLPIAATVSVGQYAKQDAPLLDAHLGRRGKRESWWKAAGIGVVGLVATLGTVFVVLLVTDTGG